MKTVNSFASASGFMPMPVSRTSKVARVAAAFGPRGGPKRPPRRSPVNLIALRRDFVSTCRRRVGSPRTTVGTSAPRPRGQLDPLLVCPRREQLEDVLDQCAQVEVDRLQLELPRLDLREVEDVVDDLQQRLAPSDTPPRRSAAACRRAASPSKQFGHPENAIHRRADLVAHVGQELRLGPAGRLREILGVSRSTRSALLRFGDVLQHREQIAGRRWRR